MHGDTQDPFADMECDWEKVEKAEAGFSSGRLPEFASYKGVCVPFDPGSSQSEEQVDHHYFVAKSTGSKCVKICLEILDPEKVDDEAVKGRTHEHLFIITVKNWPYVRRDAETILGKEIKHPKDLLTSVWAGKTVEFGVRDEEWNGAKRSKTSFFNPWAPAKPESKTETKKTGAPSVKAPTKSSAKPAPAPAPAAASGEDPAF